LTTTDINQTTVVVGIVFQLIDCPSLADLAKEKMVDWGLFEEEV
jgi:hypothetical protein